MTNDSKTKSQIYFGKLFENKAIEMEMEMEMYIPYATSCDY